MVVRSRFTAGGYASSNLSSVAPESTRHSFMEATEVGIRSGVCNNSSAESIGCSNGYHRLSPALLKRTYILTAVIKCTQSEFEMQWPVNVDLAVVIVTQQWSKCGSS